MGKIDKVKNSKITKGGSNLFKEFGAFISKGNVIDLAVGVIIGSAFGKIVTALVDNILMPLIGIIIGGIDFKSLTLKVKDAEIAYGIFIQNIIDFLIVAACIFVFIKIIGKFKRKQEVVTPEVVKDEKVELLKEIRDLLKK